MKRILLVTGVCIMTLNTFGQNKEEIEAEDVPSVVVNTLRSKFPNTTVKKWQRGDENYEANFKKDKKKYEVTISKRGQWEKTGYAVKLSQIPEKATKDVAENYIGYVIIHTSYRETAKDIFYVIIVEIAQVRTVLLFDFQGNFVREE